MANLYRVFKDLIPDAPLLVGTVLALRLDGCLISFPDGSHITARGTATLAQKVFVRDGVIEGPAPDLTVVSIDI